MSTSLPVNNTMHARFFLMGIIIMIIFFKPILGYRSFWPQLMVWLGFGLMIAGVMGRLYCLMFLEGRQGRMLMREGPYSVVRNPLHLCSLMAITGCAMESGMIVVVVLAVAGFMLYYPRIVAREEAELKQLFGEEYEAYCREVPRWEMDINLWKVPEYIEVRQESILMAMRDSVWFFIPTLVGNIASILHGKKILMVLMSLP